MDYDLTRLGDREFEHLSQALALEVLGPGVSVFGDGPDGDREAAFEGSMRFPDPDEPWDGYGVVQFTDRDWPNWVPDLRRCEAYMFATEGQISL